MAKIRGKALISTIQYIKENFPQEVWTEILEKASPEDKNILTQQIKPMGWYPVKTLVNIMNYIEEKYGKGDYDICYQIGKKAAEDAFKGMFKVFLEWGKPYTVISKAPLLWRMIYDCGNIELIIAKENYVKGRIIDFEDTHKCLCVRLKGYFEKVLELSGAKNVKVEEVKCKSWGDAFCEYEIFWEM